MLLTCVKKAVYILLISSCLSASDTQVVLKTVENVKIDGYLSEDSWKTATKITKLHSFLPEEGRPVVEKTAILLGYDPDNLFIAFVCFYKSPSNIRATITTREEIFEDDYVVFYLDTFNDGKNAYIFAFNPYGIQADGIHTEHVGEDLKPDLLFESRGRIFSNGYIVEAKIPFSSLNFPEKRVMDWKFAVIRRIQYLIHDVTWPVFTKNSTDWIGQFGKLTGIKSINKGKGIEILPEFTSFRKDNFSLVKSHLQNGPIIGDAGLNVKFGLSSGLNLDLTYNPDFSQVEADANKIDINRITPLYYAEKRPFFLEGTDIFSTPIEAFYSRQIVDPLAGIKLSGRAGEYSIGLLSALDEYQGTLQGQSKKSINNILRIKRNIFSKSTIGLIMTDREFDDSFNRVYGLDSKLTFNNNNVMTLQGLFAQTQELNSKEKLASPAFYGDYWYGTNTWNFQLFYNDFSPDFRLQNGFIRRTDLLPNGYRDLGASVYYEFRQQNKFIQHFRPYFYVSQAYNYQNEFVEGYIYSSLFFRFNFQTDLTLAHYNFKEKYTLFDEYSDLQFDKNNFSIDLSNKSLAWFTPSFYYYFGDEIYYFAPLFDVEPFIGNVNRGTIKFNFKPLNNLSTEFAYNIYRFDGENESANGTHFNFSQIQQILRAKINFQISRYFAASNQILQNDRTDYDDAYFNYADDGDLDINFLLSYMPSPGTVIFLGYNDYQVKTTGFNKGWLLGNYREQQRGFFFKTFISF